MRPRYDGWVYGMIAEYTVWHDVELILEGVMYGMVGKPTILSVSPRYNGGMYGMIAEYTI